MAAVVTIVSPFNKTISSFDDEDSFPDIIFTIPGLKDQLRLHRRDLGSASMTINALIKGQSSEFAKFDVKNKTIEWTDKRSEKDTTYRNILVKWLRFCYGEDQTFTFDECPLALTISSQLQLRYKNKQEEQDTRTLMELHMVDLARKNANSGAKMLDVCLKELRTRDGVKKSQDDQEYQKEPRSSPLKKQELNDGIMNNKRDVEEQGIIQLSSLFFFFCVCKM